MNPKWCNNLDETEAKTLTREFKQAALLRERLEVILSKEIDKSLKEMRDVARKGVVSNLAEYYADELARQRTLEDVIKLIKE